MVRAVARGPGRQAAEGAGPCRGRRRGAGEGTDYITVVSDLDAGTVEFIADERRAASLDGYYEKFTPDQLAQIQAVAMDMWEPFASSTRAHLANAEDKIVFDRYHLMGYLTKAVDTVRNAENRVLAAVGDRPWPGRSTCGCTRRRTCRPGSRTASMRCAPPT